MQLKSDEDSGTVSTMYNCYDPLDQRASHSFDRLRSNKSSTVVLDDIKENLCTPNKKPAN